MEKNCSIAKPLAFLGERRAVPVLRDLFLGRRRYSEHPERFEYVPTETGPPLEVVHGGHAFRMVPTCSECGGPGDAHDAHGRPGPGANSEERRADGGRAPEWLAR